MKISKELLSEVLNIEREIEHIDFIEKWNTFIYYVDGGAERTINIYELQHKNLKQWAKLKNVFDIIDWSEEPEQIFKKAEELRNEIN